MFVAHNDIVRVMIIMIQENNLWRVRRGGQFTNIFYRSVNMADVSGSDVQQDLFFQWGLL